MQYEQFSRQLREKYSTRFHRADQLVDRLKQKNQSAMAYLNENGKVTEPYLNECALAAERMKNNRRSERDRQICCENFILVEKLERIKRQSRENLEKDYRNHSRLVLSRTNETIRTDSTSASSITSYHSPSFLQSESSEDDQATAADVDASLDDSDCTSRHHRHFNRGRSTLTNCKGMHSSKNRQQKSSAADNDRVYQHLTNIDMTMVRDASPLPRPSPSSRHFSICILPRFDSHTITTQSKLRSHDRPYAFKKRSYTTR